MVRTFLSLGSNLGDRQAYLQSGVVGLADRGIHTVRCASLYSTEPRDVFNQPKFLNTAIEAETVLTPDELLSACLEVEKENRRIRDGAQGPRTLDIDIIFYGNEILEGAGLIIPHPRFALRRFVLVPLAEIAPQFIDPLSGNTIVRLLEACPDRGGVRLAGRLQQFS